MRREGKIMEYCPGPSPDPGSTACSTPPQPAQPPKLQQNDLANTMRSRFVLLAAAAVFVFGQLQVAQADVPEDLLRQLDERGFSGVVLIASGDRILAQQASGFASCDDQTPNTVDTVLSIGSITKMFTAAAIGHLADSGKLQFDDSLADCLNDVPEDKAAITVRQLLKHTSGLGTYHETTNAGDFEQMSREEAFEVIMRRRLRFAPGERTMYSNSGYTLLAMIVEEVSGETYVNYVRRHLLQPAGMKSTGFWGDTLTPMAATPTTLKDCSSPDSWEYSWVLVGNGGMVSTAGDLHRWMLALETDELLSDQAKAGLGFDGMLAGRSGSAGGSSQHQFNAVIEHDGREKVTVVAISNRHTVVAEDIAASLLTAVINNGTPSSPKLRRRDQLRD